MIDDRTLFKGVKKLIPGHWMEVMVPGGQLRRHQYWDANYNDNVVFLFTKLAELAANIPDNNKSRHVQLRK